MYIILLFLATAILVNLIFKDDIPKNLCQSKEHRRGTLRGKIMQEYKLTSDALLNRGKKQNGQIFVSFLFPSAHVLRMGFVDSHLSIYLYIIQFPSLPACPRRRTGHKVERCRADTCPTRWNSSFHLTKSWWALSCSVGFIIQTELTSPIERYQFIHESRLRKLGFHLLLEIQHVVIDEAAWRESLCGVVSVESSSVRPLWDVTGSLGL